jgi:hypothetical protein
MPTVPEQKIPIAIGFMNLSGNDWSKIVEEDVAVLSPLFKHVIVTKPKEMAGVPILFIYAQFNEEDGFVRNLGPLGVRQIVQMSGARLLVVASPLPAETFQKAASVPGPKTANLVFTLDRKQEHFGAFFKTLFERMRDGEDMLLAWVQIAPQGPVQRTDIPSTILIAEAGKLVFPKPSVN